MKKDMKLWDRFAKGYYKRPIADPGAYEHKLKKTREYLNPAMDALELGCGTGGTAILHSRYLKTILATDISPYMIEIAKSRPEFRTVNNVTFKVGALEELNINSKSMDVVFALSLLHLLREPQEAVDKIYEVLKPGGIFISSTTCINDILPVFKWLGPIGYQLGLIPYVNVFSADDLQAFLKNAGFEIEYQWKRDKKEGKDQANFVIATKPLV